VHGDRVDNGGIRMKAEPARIPAADIAIPDRLRSVNPTLVAELRTSLRELGLLQPIGVRAGNAAEGEAEYVLLFGAHRLMAWRAERDAALEAGDNRRWNNIPASVYPAGILPDDAAMLEIEENLRRKELTADERAAQTTIFVGLIKRRGQVRTADERRSEGRKKEVTGTDPVTSSGLTATQKAMKDLGLADAKTVRNRVVRSRELAKEAGLCVPDKMTPEATDAETLLKVGEAALAAASRPARKTEKKRNRKAGGARDTAANTELPPDPELARESVRDVVQTMENLWLTAGAAQKCEIAEWLVAQPDWPLGRVLVVAEGALDAGPVDLMASGGRSAQQVSKGRTGPVIGRG
jgi:hypothetical protein